MSDTKWFPDIPIRNIEWYTNKHAAINTYVQNMLSRTSQMFSYASLPSTIPSQLMEINIQTKGLICITQVSKSQFIPDRIISNNMGISKDPIESPFSNSAPDMNEVAQKADEATEDLTGTSADEPDDLYFFACDPGDQPDIYYRPTQVHIANPLLSVALTRTIGKDCVIIPNDIFNQGLLPTLIRYAREYLEADISIIGAFYNTRMRTIIEASAGPELEAAKQYLKDVEAGKLAAIGTRALIDGLKVWPQSTNHASELQGIIEARQAIQVAWYNELGIDPNFSVKREYVSAEEISSNTDLLMPLIDHMLVCRKLGFDAVNDMFGTNINVEKSSAWAHKARIAQSNSMAIAAESAGEQNENHEHPDSE